MLKIWIQPIYSRLEIAEGFSIIYSDRCDSCVSIFREAGCTRVHSVTSQGRKSARRNGKEKVNWPSLRRCYVNLRFDYVYGGG